MSAATFSRKLRLKWGRLMEYEIYEPDPNDEFYDELCSAAWSSLFSKGVNHEYPQNHNVDLRYSGRP